jgi:hypothetical protein
LRIGESALSKHEPVPVFDIELSADSMVDLNQPAAAIDSAGETRTVSADGSMGIVSSDQRGIKGRYALLMNILRL